MTGKKFLTLAILAAVLVLAALPSLAADAARTCGKDGSCCAACKTDAACTCGKDCSCCEACKTGAACTCDSATPKADAACKCTDCKGCTACKTGAPCTCGKDGSCGTDCKTGAACPGGEGCKPASPR